MLYHDEHFLAELEGAVYALDATIIELCLKLFPWAKAHNLTCPPYRDPFRILDFGSRYVPGSASPYAPPCLPAGASGVLVSHFTIFRSRTKIAYNTGTRSSVMNVARLSPPIWA